MADVSSRVQDDPPADWRVQLADLVEDCPFETVLRVIDGWRPGQPAQGITDEMVEAGARALVSADAWNRMSPRAHEQMRSDVRDILSAALAGRTILDLPAPDERTYGGSVRWDASAGSVIAKVDNQGRPFIRLDGQIWLVGEAESVGLALVAAAREARRLAAESLTQKGDDQ